MLILPNTTSKIQVLVGSAGDIECHSSYIDAPNPIVSGATVTPGANQNNILAASTVDIVAAPAASTVRNVKFISIRNNAPSNSNTIVVRYNDASSNPDLFSCTLAAGELLNFVEASGWNIFAADGSFKAQSARVLFKVLSADVAGIDSSAAQPWFPSAGAVALAAATSYFFEGELFLTRSAGAVSHTTGLLFGGTATLISIDWMASAKVGDTNALAALSGFRGLAATELVLKVASTSTTENSMFNINGIVRTNAAGTFIPQFKFSAAPGGAPQVKRGSFFRLWPIGDNNVVSAGTWS